MERTLQRQKRLLGGRYGVSIRQKQCDRKNIASGRTNLSDDEGNKLKSYPKWDWNKISLHLIQNETLLPLIWNKILLHPNWKKISLHVIRNEILLHQNNILLSGPRFRCILIGTRFFGMLSWPEQDFVASERDIVASERGLLHIIWTQILFHL